MGERVTVEGTVDAVIFHNEENGYTVLLLAVERHGVPIYEYTPSQVKQAVVGYGKAEKRQVMDMTKRLLNLKAVPNPDDAADAVAIALCHARSYTSRLQSPDANRPGSGRYAVRKD